MPLFIFKCERCDAAFERLVGQRENRKTLRCRRCGGASARQEISCFNVAGMRSRTSSASLTASGAEFVSNPDSFVTAMESFGDKIGDRLTARQIDNAVDKLKQAKR